MNPLVTQKTRVAFVYDFDGTLAKGNIQENSFLPQLGIPRKTFWKETEALAKKHEADAILTYMYLLITKAKERGVPFRREDLVAHGKDVRYFQGVEDFFERANAFAASLGLELEHYIISSGTREMIEATTIARHFRCIYASSFIYDVNDVPIWPGIAINYTTKTQYLFRINKGIENAWDNKKINTFMPMEERPVPFSNMVYLGDGMTDVPAMKMVNAQGGTSIGVYAPRSKQKSKVEELLRQQRVTYVAPADYREGSILDTLLQEILKGMAARIHAAQLARPMP